MESEFHKDDANFCNQLEALLPALATHTHTKLRSTKPSRIRSGLGYYISAWREGRWSFMCVSFAAAAAAAAAAARVAQVDLEYG